MGLEDLLRRSDIPQDALEIIEEVLGEDAGLRHVLCGTLWETTLRMVLALDREGRILDLNPAAEALYGVSREEALGQDYLERFLPPEAREAVAADIRKVLKGDPTDGFQNPVVGAGGEERVLRWSVRPFKGLSGEAEGIVAFGEDMTEPARTEARRTLRAELLHLLNEPGTPVEAIRQALTLIRDYARVESTGLRFRRGDDYPFYVHLGFPGEFIEAENALCAYDDAGELIRDKAGKPVLECMCGNIINEKTDPGQPFFTEGGSFFTTSTTELLASTTEEDRQARTRNRCHSEGYETVALIPLRCSSGNIGLLQLNDRRRGALALDTVTFFEGIAASVGIALERKLVEEERERVIGELREALGQVRTLHGLLPICACCKKIRDDEGYWENVEAYIRARTEAEFTHSLCPICLEVELSKIPRPTDG